MFLGPVVLAVGYTLLKNWIPDPKKQLAASDAVPSESDRQFWVGDFVAAETIRAFVDAEARCSKTKADAPL